MGWGVVLTSGPAILPVQYLCQDGNVDIVAGGPGTPSLWYYLSDGAKPPNFTPYFITTTLEYYGLAAAVGDINADGAMDIAYTVSTGSGTNVAVPWANLLVNNGGSPPTFTAYVLESATDQSGTGIIFMDVDSDGNMDIVAGTTYNDQYSGSVQWFRSNGAKPTPQLTDVMSVSSIAWDWGGRSTLAPSMMDLVSVVRE